MDAVDEVTPDSWTGLLEALAGRDWPQAHDVRVHLAYRGIARRGDGLDSGLVRLGPEPRRLEAHLLRNFRKYAHRYQPPRDSVWDWLSLGRHHGLPTRLLDWTFSPYVALHFVTASPVVADEDGVVWCVDYRAVHRDLPPKLATALGDEGADVFTTEMLDEAAPDLPAYDALAAGGAPFVAFFEPPSLDDRIVNQAAVFSATAGSWDGMGPWLAARPGVARRVVVPAALKPEVRDRLDEANVTERVLFPGLDGLAQWLSRYYAPRPGRPPDAEH